jgi:hypothetical protein
LQNVVRHIESATHIVRGDDMIVANLCESSAAKRQDGQQGLAGGDIKWTAGVRRLRGTGRRLHYSYFGC